MSRRIPALMRRGGRGVVASGGAPALTYMPTTNLVLGLDARDGVTQAANLVSAWTDQSSTGADASQGTAANQPTYDATGGPGGTPCVKFGASSVKVTTGMPLAATIPTGPITMYAVLRRQNNTTVRQRLLAGSGTRILGSISNTASIPGWFDTTWQKPGSPTGIAAGTWHVLTYVLSNAGGECFENGASIGTDTYAEGSFTSPYICCAAGDETTGNLDGALAGLFIYGTAHDATARTAHLAVINTIWGL